MLEQMLEQIKNAVHITDNDMEQELLSDIFPALEDMRRVGVTAANNDTTSPLMIKCVELYVKWQIDYLGQAERFQKHYEKLRDSLSQGSDYNSES